MNSRSFYQIVVRYVLTTLLALGVVAAPAFAFAKAGIHHEIDDSVWRGGIDNGIGNGGRNMGIGRAAGLHHDDESEHHFWKFASSTPHGFHHDDDDDEDDDENQQSTSAVPLILNNMSAISDATSTATVSWTTNLPSTSTVFYGTTTPLDINASTTASVSSTTLSTTHSVSILGLVTGAIYNFIIQSVTALGLTATSSPFSLTIQ